MGRSRRRVVSSVGWPQDHRPIVLVVHRTAGGRYQWEPRDGLERLTPAEREEAAAWLAAETGLTHEEAYAALWSR